MKLLLLSVFAFFTFLASFSQKTTVIGKTDYPFWVYTPSNKPINSKLPLIVFLHGRSLSGTNIQKVRNYGMLYAIDRGTSVPAIVVAPQLASGSWNPDKVLEIIEYAKQNYKIDASKIYVCGMSLGGYGTLHFAGKYADKITAAVAVCGGGYTKDACKLGTIPLWIQHGDKDKIVPLSESSKMVDAIKKCNPNADCKFTIVKNGHHGNVEKIFHSNTLYNWLFEHSKKSH